MNATATKPRARAARAVVLAATALLVAAGCGPSGGAEEAGELVLGKRAAEDVPRVPDDPELRRGFEIWSALCSSCHGPAGRGDGAVADQLAQRPRDLTDPDAIRFPSEPERRRVIAEGIEGTTMVGWRGVLDDRGIELVSAYVEHLQDRDPER